MTTRRVVRERIDPRLTGALFANYRSALDAVLELVDNAVDSRLPGRALEVDLIVRPGSLVLTVVGGTGMGPAGLEREYLRWGASGKRAGERIGRYGQGGKAAIGHLGGRFAIVASPAGESRAWSFADDAYRDRTRLRTYELHERVKPVAPELGLVRIEIGAVDRAIDPRRLAARLAETYRPLVEAAAISMRVNRAPVVPSAWQLDERHAIGVRAGGRLVHGWWGLLPDPPPAGSEPGVRLYHHGRLVGAPDWFGHPGPAAHPALARLVGEVELPHVAVTMNKSDVERDGPEWIAVEERLHRLLAPAVRRLTREPGATASPQARRTAEQVRRILARALRMLETGALFEGAGGAAGADEPEGTEGQLTLSQVAHRLAAPIAPEVPAAGGASDSAEGKPAEPEPEEAPGQEVPRQAPPIRRASGRGGRQGVGEVVVRALDPRIRSAMEEEDGVRRIVINARYPLYEVRKGDLWYQLETALREVCVTIPEATVPEFERKVNELILVSLALTRRRRRGRRRAAGEQQIAWGG